jgi:tetratricopeptide (TPR) repeat protein
MPADHTLNHKSVSTPRQLPGPPAHFNGRAAELRAALQQPVPAVLGLWGTEGSGKTALALMLVKELAPRYPDGALLVDFEGTAATTSAAVMAQIIRAYHPTVALPDDEATIRAKYRETLRERRVLLLFDSAMSREQVLPVMPPAGCALLVTSPEQLDLPGLRSLKIGGLTSEVAAALLLQFAPRIGQLATELAELCGYFPLALRLAGSALSQKKDLDPAAYVERLQAEEWHQDKLDEIQATLALGYDLLSLERQQRWQELSVFPSDFDLPAAAAVLSIDDRAARRVLADAVGYGLLTFDHRSKRFRMHNLVRRTAIEHQSATKFGETRQRHASHYLGVLHKIDAAWMHGRDGIIHGLRWFDLERPQILAGQAWAALYADQDRSAASLASAYAAAGDHVLLLRQTSRERLAWLETGQRAANQLRDREAEVLHLRRLGSVFRHTDDPRRAVDFYERSLRLAREIGDRQGEGRALGKLGLAYVDLGDIKRAMAYYQQELQVALKRGDRLDEARASWNLGLAYEELGDLTQAIQAMEVCVAFERETGHPDAEPDAAKVRQLRARLNAENQRRPPGTA